MIDHDRRYFHAVDFEVVVGIDDVQFIGRYAGIQLLAEAVVKALTQLVSHIALGVYRHVLAVAIWAKVFDAADVVEVDVGE